MRPRHEMPELRSSRAPASGLRRFVPSAAKAREGLRLALELWGGLSLMAGSWRLISHLFAAWAK